jgi:uncharacterized protein (DUF302 family)
MSRCIFILMLILGNGAQVMAADGLTTVKSDHSPAETIARLESAIKANGMTVFARIDHASAAKEAGMELRPTEVLIFGAAKGGTPLMRADQTIGLDLPLKALVWQDANGQTWISFNDPEWLANRHGLGPEAKPVATKLKAVLSSVVGEAARSR